jgi:peroxiredoxin
VLRDDGLKRKLTTGLVLAFIVGLIALFAYPDYRQGEPSLHGRTAKDFQVTLDGKPVRLSQNLRGKVVVLNFWATWCVPCIDEVPSLNELQRHIDPLGGTIVGVNVGINDTPDAYAAFLKQYNIDFPTYFDSSQRIAAGYGTTMYPETYVIDRDGRIDRKIIGPQDWASPEMLAYFQTLLSEK